jgi:hypothetical protein
MVEILKGWGKGGREGGRGRGRERERGRKSGIQGLSWLKSFPGEGFLKVYFAMSTKGDREIIIMDGWLLLIYKVIKFKVGIVQSHYS